MGKLKKIHRDGILKYCENLPIPIVVIDGEYNVIFLNPEARRQFPDHESKSKCYQITHNLDKPCWEVKGDSACPVKKLKSESRSYAFHEHESGEYHVLVAEKLDEDLFMELYLDGYITDIIREFKFLAEIDSLTGFYNRKKIENLLNQEVERASRYKKDLSLLFIDLDNFKEINDTYGHLTGDKVIKEVAQIIKEEIRRTDFVGRFGGEEFLVVLPETRPSEALKVANRIRKRVEDKRTGVGRITVSIGVTCMREGENPETLFNRVDRAMYLAKEKGKNRVEVL